MKTLVIDNLIKLNKRNYGNKVKRRYIKKVRFKF